MTQPSGKELVPPVSVPTALSAAAAASTSAAKPIEDLSASRTDTKYGVTATSGSPPTPGAHPSGPFNTFTGAGVANALAAQKASLAHARATASRATTVPLAAAIKRTASQALHPPSLSRSVTQQRPVLSGVSVVSPLQPSAEQAALSTPVSQTTSFLPPSALSVPVQPPSQANSSSDLKALQWLAAIDRYLSTLTVAIHFFTVSIVPGQ